MNRREFAVAGAAALTAGFAPALSADDTVNKPLKWAPYARTLAIDGSGGFGRYYPGREDSSFDALDLGDARESGLSAVVLTLAPRGFPRFTNEAFEGIKGEITYWDQKLAAHPETFTMISKGADLARAQRERKAGLIYGFQDSSPIGEDLDRIDMFQKRGVRVIQLTHNQRNLVGDGCMEPGNAGLSEYGRQVIERLNAQRILVDVAHASRRTTIEGILASKAPVLISHTGCAALSDLPRCVTDEALRAMADRGGVAGIVFWPYLRRQGQQTAQDIIRHVEHVIKICGEDHVGLGSDATVSAVDITPAFVKENREMMERLIEEGIFEPRSPDLYLFPPDLNHTRRFETLGAMLSARGHSDTRIAKILGGNFARVMSEVWG